MPLAQNYKDDVSLLESETALSKTTMNSNTDTEFSTSQDASTKPNVCIYLYSILVYYLGVSEKRSFFTL